MISKIIFVIYILIKILIIVLPMLIAIAYLTLIERKVISAIQRRKGPNIVGFFWFIATICRCIKVNDKRNNIT